MSSLETTAQHVARRLELLTNWLALLALLAIGIIWGPSPDEGAGTLARPVVSLHAAAEAPRPTRSSSARPHQAQSPPARAPCRG